MDDSYWRTPNGRRWSRIAWVNRPTPGAAEATTVASSKRSFGSCGREARRDLPPFFGNTVFKRYRDWVRADVFARLSRPARTRRTWNTRWSMPPSSRSIATDRAQKGDSRPGHRPFQRRHDDQNPGADRCARQSRALRAAARPPLRYRWRRSAHRWSRLGGFIADKAFDSNSIIADLNERGAKIVISQHPRRASPLPIDAELYKWRHLIENFFCKLKEFKRIAMRADKTDQSFAANIHLAAAVINSR